MNICEFYGELNRRIPPELSEEWDNDGLMVTPGAVCEVSRVLVSLDASEDAVNYAAENGFDTILTHHPLIFRKLSSVTPESTVGRKVIFALMNNISVISLHTRLDAAPGGVNDCLAAALGLSDTKPFGGGTDMGRTGKLPREMKLCEFAKYAKEALGSSTASYSHANDREKTVKTVAVLGGAGGDFALSAKKAGADVLVTGEAGYHIMSDSAEDDIPVVALGHFFTENVVLEKLASLARDITPCETELFRSSGVEGI